jgi:dihydrofolate reductase
VAVDAAFPLISRVMSRRAGRLRPSRDGAGRRRRTAGTFAFDGLEAAARRARDAAGDKDVLVLGAHVAGQLLGAGLLDEVRIHLVPLVLGQGTPLFAGERAELIPEGKPVAGAVTHLRYRVAKP